MLDINTHAQTYIRMYIGYMFMFAINIVTIYYGDE